MELSLQSDININERTYSSRIPLEEPCCFSSPISIPSNLLTQLKLHYDETLSNLLNIAYVESIDRLAIFDCYWYIQTLIIIGIHLVPELNIPYSLIHGILKKVESSELQPESKQYLAALFIQLQNALQESRSKTSIPFPHDNHATYDSFMPSELQLFNSNHNSYNTSPLYLSEKNPFVHNLISMQLLRLAKKLSQHLDHDIYFTIVNSARHHAEYANKLLRSDQLLLDYPDSNSFHSPRLSEWLVILSFLWQARRIEKAKYREKMINKCLEKALCFQTAWLTCEESKNQHHFLGNAIYDLSPIYMANIYSSLHFYEQCAEWIHISLKRDFYTRDSDDLFDLEVIRNSILYQFLLIHPGQQERRKLFMQTNESCCSLDTNPYLGSLVDKNPLTSVNESGNYLNHYSHYNNGYSILNPGITASNSEVVEIRPLEKSLLREVSILGRVQFQPLQISSYSCSKNPNQNRLEISVHLKRQEKKACPMDTLEHLNPFDKRNGEQHYMVSSDSLLTAHIPNSEGPLSAEKRLQERLKLFHFFKHRTVPGDGNCQMYSLSDQLFGTFDKAMEIRQNVVKWLRENENLELANGALLKDFAHDYQCWENYCDAMAQPGIWGDHLTLMAAAEVYNTKIVIITSTVDEAQSVQCITPIKQSQRIVYLCHYQEYHYGTITMI